MNMSLQAVLYFWYFNAKMLYLRDCLLPRHPHIGHSPELLSVMLPDVEACEGAQPSLAARPDTATHQV